MSGDTMLVALCRSLHWSLDDVLSLTWSQIGRIGKALLELSPDAAVGGGGAASADFDHEKADGGEAYQDRVAGIFRKSATNGKVKLGALLQQLGNAEVPHG